MCATSRVAQRHAGRVLVDVGLRETRKQTNDLGRRKILPAQVLEVRVDQCYAY